MTIIATIDELEAIYHVKPVPASTVKEVDRITAHYRALIEGTDVVKLAPDRRIATVIGFLDKVPSA